MPRLFQYPFASLVLSLAILAGCQTSGPGQGPAPGDVTPNAVTGDAIEVTALDAGPAPSPAALPTSPPATETPPAPASPTGTSGTADPGVAIEPSAEPAPADVPSASAEPEPEAAPEVAPPPKSAQQLACERKRGTWALTGKGEIRICIFRTRDGGKRCTGGNQCDGECLARSGTCSPIKPLIGCNEVLVDNGARVTQCIE